MTKQTPASLQLLFGQVTQKWQFSHFIAVGFEHHES
jgi:hypothetical protein